MRPVQIRVRGDHLRLKPDAEFHAESLHAVYQVRKLSDFLFVDKPVSESAVVAVSFSEPAVIHYHHLDAAVLRILCDAHNFIGVEIEIGRFPVVDENRAQFFFPGTADDMPPDEIVIRMRHRSESGIRIRKNGLRCIEGLAAAKLPGEEIRIDAERSTNHIVLALLCHLQMIAGIHEKKSVHIALLLIGSRLEKCKERIFLVP